MLRNEMVDTGPYGVTGVMGLYGVYGIKNVLEIVNPRAVQALLKTIKPYIMDRAESMGDVKVRI